MKVRLIFTALLINLAIVSTSFAAIIIEDRTGAIEIFMPDDKQIVVQVGEPLPVIPDGARITILAGTAGN